MAGPGRSSRLGAAGERRRVLGYLRAGQQLPRTGLPRASLALGWGPGCGDPPGCGDSPAPAAEAGPGRCLSREWGGVGSVPQNTITVGVCLGFVLFVVFFLKGSALGDSLLRVI